MKAPMTIETSRTSTDDHIIVTGSRSVQYFATNPFSDPVLLSPSLCALQQDVSYLQSILQVRHPYSSQLFVNTGNKSTSINLLDFGLNIDNK